MHTVLHLAQQVADVLNATDAEWSMKLSALGIAGSLLTHEREEARASLAALVEEEATMLASECLPSPEDDH